MSNKSMSKMDMRSAIVALSVVAMLVVSFGVSNVGEGVRSLKDTGKKVGENIVSKTCFSFDKSG